MQEAENMINKQALMQANVKEILNEKEKRLKKEKNDLIKKIELEEKKIKGIEFDNESQIESTELITLKILRNKVKMIQIEKLYSKINKTLDLKMKTSSQIFSVK